MDQEQEATIRELIDRLSRGNPLLDPDAFADAVRRGGEDARVVIKTMRDAVHANLDEFFQQLIQASEPGAGNSESRED